MTPRRVLAWVVVTTMASALALALAGGLYLAENPSARQALLASLHGATYLGPNPGGILQERAYDCGPTALQIALHQLGVTTSRAELFRDAGTTEGGTSMLGLKTACERQGVSAKGWKLTWQSLHEIPLPAIVLVDGDHYIVVREISAEAVGANDPAVGSVRMSRAAFVRRWSGYTLTMMRFR